MEYIAHRDGVFARLEFVLLRVPDDGVQELALDERKLVGNLDGTGRFVKKGLFERLHAAIVEIG